MRLAVFLAAACLLQLGRCRPGADAVDPEARDPFFTGPRAAGTFYYWVDLTVDAETPCQEFRESAPTRVVLRMSLKAVLEEIAAALGTSDFIAPGGRVRCRNSESGGTIRLVQVIVQTQPGTNETLAKTVAEQFASSENIALFLTKLGRRMANKKGALEDYKSASLATYKGARSASRAAPRAVTSALGFGTEPPPKLEFNSQQDLEKLPCSNTNPATCPSLCTCAGECLNGVCLITGECAANSDCKDANQCGKTRCDTAQQKCVVALNGTACTNARNGKPSVCTGNGLCRVCQTGADCAGTFESGSCYTCDLNLNQCLPLSDGETCTYGTSNGTNVINGTYYGTNATASGYCYRRMCVECMTDRQCGACEKCDQGVCVAGNDGTSCYAGYVKSPTGYCAKGICKECIGLTPTLDTCPTGATCSSSSTCTCNKTSVANTTSTCYGSDGKLVCSATYVQLCGDAQCTQNKKFCAGSFTDLTDFLWNRTTVNLGVYTSGNFTLTLYNETGYTALIKSIAGSGQYDYYAKNGGKLLNADVLSLKLTAS